MFDYKDNFHKLGMQYQVTVVVTVDAVVVTTIIISTIKGCRSEWWSENRMIMCSI